MRKLTNTEKAQIVCHLAEGWETFWNADVSYDQFKRIVDGVTALAEAGMRTDVPWCPRTGELRGFCMGCERNEFPWSGDPLGCADLPGEVTDLLIKLDRGESFPKK